MSDKFFVSFNSPQCGWMSIGLTGGGTEFHTTTAHAPHKRALPNLLEVLTDLLDENSDGLEFLIQWNRDPEEFDFWFRRTNGKIRLEVWQYATGRRLAAEREKVFVYAGDVLEIAGAFHQTFSHLRADIETDEFEQNWRQPFPHREFERFDRAYQQVRAALAAK